jgi:hypothetical protein
VSYIVGRPCPMCRAEAVQAIRVFDWRSSRNVIFSDFFSSKAFVVEVTLNTQVLWKVGIESQKDARRRGPLSEDVQARKKVKPRHGWNVDRISILRETEITRFLPSVNGR